MKDDDGDPMQGSFSYSSILGMMLYLAGNTRPDIAYSVHCAARFAFCPKKSHEDALKRIGRYLWHTDDTISSSDAAAGQFLISLVDTLSILLF